MGKRAEVFCSRFKYRVPGRMAFLLTGPASELGARVLSYCAQTCCRRQPERDPPRSP